LHKFFEEKKRKFGGAIEGHKGHDIHSIPLFVWQLAKKKCSPLGGAFSKR
jgi:hypothetical protein